MRVAKLNLLLLAALVACAAALAGCTGSPLQVPAEMSVQVPVACIKPQDRPQRPALRAETDLMAMDRYHRTLAAWSDLKKHEIYAAALEAIVDGCSRIPPAR